MGSLPYGTLCGYCGVNTAGYIPDGQPDGRVEPMCGECQDLGREAFRSQRFAPINARLSPSEVSRIPWARIAGWRSDPPDRDRRSTHGGRACHLCDGVYLSRLCCTGTGACPRMYGYIHRSSLVWLDGYWVPSELLEIFLRERSAQARTIFLRDRSVQASTTSASAVAESGALGTAAHDQAMAGAGGSSGGPVRRRFDLARAGRANGGPYTRSMSSSAAEVPAPRISFLRPPPARPSNFPPKRPPLTPRPPTKPPPKRPPPKPPPKQPPQVKALPTAQQFAVKASPLSPAKQSADAALVKAQPSVGWHQISSRLASAAASVLADVPATELLAILDIDAAPDHAEAELVEEQDAAEHHMWGGGAARR